MSTSKTNKVEVTEEMERADRACNCKNTTGMDGPRQIP